MAYSRRASPSASVRARRLESNRQKSLNTRRESGENPFGNRGLPAGTVDSVGSVACDFWPVKSSQFLVYARRPTVPPFGKNRRVRPGGQRRGAGRRARG